MHTPSLVRTEVTKEYVIAVVSTESGLNSNSSYYTLLVLEFNSEIKSCFINCF